MFIYLDQMFSEPCPQVPQYYLLVLLYELFELFLLLLCFEFFFFLNKFKNKEKVKHSY